MLRLRLPLCNPVERRCALAAQPPGGMARFRLIEISLIDQTAQRHSEHVAEGQRSASVQQ